MFMHRYTRSSVFVTFSLSNTHRPGALIIIMQSFKKTLRSRIFCRKLFLLRYMSVSIIQSVLHVRFGYFLVKYTILLFERTHTERRRERARFLFFAFVSHKRDTRRSVSRRCSLRNKNIEIFSLFRSREYFGLCNKGRSQSELGRCMTRRHRA